MLVKRALTLALPPRTAYGTTVIVITFDFSGVGMLLPPGPWDQTVSSSWTV